MAIKYKVGVGGHYSDIGDAWSALHSKLVLTDDYEFSIISNFVEATGVAGTGSDNVTFNGHTITFINDKNYVITYNGQYYFRDDGGAASVSDVLILDGLIIKQSAIPGGLVRIIRAAPWWAANTMSVIYRNLQIFSIANGTGAFGTTYGISPIVGSNKITMYNCKIYNCHVGIEMGVDINATSSGNFIDNCTIYNSGNRGIDFTYAASTSLKYCTFNNVVSCGSLVSDWGTGGVGPGNYFIFNNCADSDNSLSALLGTKTNCVANIVPVDEFESLDVTNPDFLYLKKGALAVNADPTPNKGKAPLRVRFNSDIAYVWPTGVVLPSSGNISALTPIDITSTPYGKYGDYPIGCHNAEVAY